MASGSQPLDDCRFFLFWPSTPSPVEEEEEDEEEEEEDDDEDDDADDVAIAEDDDVAAWSAPGPSGSKLVRYN